MLLPLLAVLKKEFLLLVRDIHGLLLLFVMPAIFILLMSLAMQQNFAARTDAKLDVIAHDLAQTDDAKGLLEQLAGPGVFDFSLYDKSTPSESLVDTVKRDEAAFMLTIHPRKDVAGDGNTLAVDLLVAPATNKQTEVIFVATVREALRGVKVAKLLEEFEDSSLGGGESVDSLAAVDLTVDYAYDGGESESPTAVQQNVPAWLVFAMFFVVVPLSNTLIKERQMGTLRRLRTVNVSPMLLVVGKLLPYFVIMQLQVIVMLLLGIYVVPLFGGDSLVIRGSWVALAMMSAAIAVAALGYAALIAVVTNTTEQATTLGGAGNIILAALGGIMVPTFVMPLTMQRVSQASPMNWGLEGFLDIFLRSGDVVMVWPKVLALVAFGAILSMLALLVLSRRQD